MDFGSGLARTGSLLIAGLVGGAAAVGIGAAIDNDPEARTIVTTVAADPPPRNSSPP